MARVTRILHPALILGGIVLAGGAAFGWPAGTIFPAGPRWLALALLGLLLTFVWRRDAGVTAVEIWAGALLGWCLFSLTWSPDLGAGFISVLRAGALVAVGVGIARAPEKVVRLIPGLAGISAIIVIILAFVWPVSFGGFGNENAITAFLILAVPLSWIGWRPGAVVVTALAAVFLLYFNGSQLEFPVVGGAALAVVVTYVWKRTRWGAVGLLVGAAILAIPLVFVPAYGFFGSFASRFELWGATMALIGQAPLLGHGLGGFDYLFSTVQGDTGRVFSLPFMWANAAHNDFLELASMTGLVGVGMAMGLVVSLLRTSAPLAVRWTIYSGLILTFGDFPFQQPAAALVLVVAAGLVARGAVRFSAARYEGFVARGALVGLILVAIPFFTNTWRSQALFSQAYIIAGTHPALALKAAMDAMRIQSSDPFIRRHLMLYLANAERWCANNSKCQATIPHAAADNVFALAISAGPAFPGLRIARAQYMLNANRWDEPEMLTLLQGLQTRFSHYPETWILSAWAAQRRHDALGMIVSFKHLADLNLGPKHKTEIKRLMKIVTIQPNPLTDKL